MSFKERMGKSVFLYYQQCGISLYLYPILCTFIRANNICCNLTHLYQIQTEQRAKRFGITAKPTPPAKKQQKNKHGNNNNNSGKKGGKGGNNNSGKKGGKGGNQKNQKQQAGNKRRESGGGGNNNNNKQQQKKKQKIEAKKETPLLPKDEIEKRLARAQKYGTTEGVDELKAMLRKHRFTSS